MFDSKHMVYISIGDACNMKYQIKSHRNDMETLFFDWLLVDMESVIFILNQYKNIDNLLNRDNIIIKGINRANNAYLKICLKRVSKCLFIHDVKTIHTEDDINEFIDKYKRRFKRLIELINGPKKIFFCRFNTKPLAHDINKLFINTIKQINPRCNFFLVCINSFTKKYSVKKEGNYLEIDLEINLKASKSYKRCKTQIDWTTSHLGWNNIFDTIEKNT